MTKLFQVGDEVHRVGDADCPECGDEYPEPCRCGGLIHAASGEDVDAEGDPIVTTLCDRCGRSEEELSPP